MECELYRSLFNGEMATLQCTQQVTMLPKVHGRKFQGLRIRKHNSRRPCATVVKAKSQYRKFCPNGDEFSILLIELNTGHLTFVAP